MKTDVEIQQAVERGHFPIMAAIELSKAPAAYRTEVLKRIRRGKAEGEAPSAAEVRRAVKEVSAKRGATTDTTKGSTRKKGKDRAASDPNAPTGA